MNEEEAIVEGLAAALYAADGEGFVRLRPFADVTGEARMLYRRLAQAALVYLAAHPWLAELRAPAVGP